MLIAQITDIHALPAGGTLNGLDSNTMLSNAVEHLDGLLPLPDVVLVTGDLVESGEEKAYRQLRCALEKLRIPYYLIVGNHDCRKHLRAVFRETSYLPAAGFVQYAVEQYPVRLLGLDTLDDGRGGGRLCPERLSWLDETLAEAPERPTMLFMHHPPFETGIAWMDKSFFVGGAEFKALLGRHRQVERVICGHLHRSISTTFGDVLVTVAPSTCYQVHLDLEPSASPHIIREPPACHLHMWNGSAFITHESLIDFPTAPIDLSKPVSSV